YDLHVLAATALWTERSHGGEAELFQHLPDFDSFMEFIVKIVRGHDVLAHSPHEFVAAIEKRNSLLPNHVASAAFQLFPGKSDRDLLHLPRAPSISPAHARRSCSKSSGGVTRAPRRSGEDGWRSRA